jgi:geranylgeranyl reductase family protein
MHPDATSYDVVIAGAGPAGVAFARTARRLNPALRVAVVEKYKFPRDKICGDGLTFLARPLLAEIFPDVDLSAHLATGAADKVSVRAPFGRKWYQFPQTVAVVPRRVLDEKLAATLPGDGVELLEETQVVDLVRDDAGRVTGVKVRGKDGATRALAAGLVVGADGSAGTVRRKTGSMQGDHTINAIRQYVRGVPAQDDGLLFDIHVDDDFGYFWCFPFEKDGERWANIGYGSFSTPTSLLRRRYEGYLARPDIARCLQGGTFVGKPEAFPINLARLKGHRLQPPRASHGEGFVLIGDAAAIVHPYTGEGISFALESGRAAAESYFGAEGAAAAGARYEARLRKTLKPTHQVLAAYLLLRFPTKLPKRLIQPYFDGVIGTIRALRRFDPKLLKRELLSH